MKNVVAFGGICVTGFTFWASWSLCMAGNWFWPLFFLAGCFGFLVSVGAAITKVDDDE